MYLSRKLEVCGEFKAIRNVLLCFRISVENAYMEEKEDTASALGEIAINAG